MSSQAVTVSYLGNNQFSICADAAGYAAVGTGSAMKGSTMFVFEPKCGGKSGIYKATGHTTPEFSAALSGSTVSADCSKSISCTFTDSSGELSKSVNSAGGNIWAIGDTLSPFAQHKDGNFGSGLNIGSNTNPKTGTSTSAASAAATGVSSTKGAPATSAAATGESSTNKLPASSTDQKTEPPAKKTNRCKRRK